MHRQVAFIERLTIKQVSLYLKINNASLKSWKSHKRRGESLFALNDWISGFLSDSSLIKASILSVSLEIDTGAKK